MTPTQAQHHAFARSDRSPLGVWWWTMDRWLLGVVATLIGLGVLMSFAASPAAAARTMAPLVNLRIRTLLSQSCHCRIIRTAEEAGQLSACLVDFV